MKNFVALTALIVVVALASGCAGPRIVAGNGINVHEDNGEYVITVDLEGGNGITVQREYGGTMSISLEEADGSEVAVDPESKRGKALKWLEDNQTETEGDGQ